MKFIEIWYRVLQDVTILLLAFWFLPGHALLLQPLFSLLAPTQAFPPFWAAVTIVLVLSCTPFPQDLEHFDHSPQEDFLQSVGPPLHMPHVFLQFTVTNAFIKPKAQPHFIDAQYSLLSLHSTGPPVINDKKLKYI